MRKNYFFLQAVLCVAFFSSCQKQQSPQNTSTDQQTVDKIAQSYGYKPYSGPMTLEIQQLRPLSTDEFLAEMAKRPVGISSKGQKTIEGGPVTNGAQVYTYVDEGDSLNPLVYYYNTRNSGVRFPNLEYLHIPAIFTFSWEGPQYGNGGVVYPAFVGIPLIYGRNLQASWSYQSIIHQYVSGNANATNLYFVGQMASYLNISGTVYTAAYQYVCSVTLSIVETTYLKVQAGIGLTLE
jgi:hypothetical protein